MYVLKSIYMHLRGKYKSPISSSQYGWLSQTERQMYIHQQEASSGYSSPSVDTSSSMNNWGADSSSSYDSGSSSSDSSSSIDFGGGDSGGGGASGDW